MAPSSAGIHHDNNQLIEIRKVKYDFASLNDYQEFQAEMLSMAIHPWIKKAALFKDNTDQIPEGVWAIIGCEKTASSVSNLVLLAFVELGFEETTEARQPFEGISSFDEWVAQFNPRTKGDWLMVPKLFLMYLNTGRNLPELIATEDPWIDAVLRESRGMLMWSYQFIEIIRMIADIGITEATKIHSRYLMMRLKHR